MRSVRSDIAHIEQKARRQLPLEAKRPFLQFRHIPWRAEIGKRDGKDSQCAFRRIAEAGVEDGYALIERIVIAGRRSVLRPAVQKSSEAAPENGEIVFSEAVSKSNSRREVHAFGVRECVSIWIIRAADHNTVAEILCARDNLAVRQHGGRLCWIEQRGIEVRDSPRAILLGLEELVSNTVG